MLRRVTIWVVSTTGVILLAWWGLASWERAFMDTKTVRTGTGIVERKDHVVFSSDNNTFTNDSGITLTRHVGSEEYRLYYRVTDFGPYPESKARILNAAEDRRWRSGNLRYAIVEKQLFDVTAVGDVLRFHNQYVGGDDAMTWGFENTRYPDSP